eukprot:Skav208328  [mRNA]  locus=scaffold1961:115781:117235:+ [translate_table: standard]
MCEKSADFRKLLTKSLKGTGFVQPVLYMDEATSGNVLSVDKGRKTMLFYMGFLESWHYLKSPSSWIVLAAVQTECTQAMKGNASAVVIEIIKRILTKEAEEGFNLPGNIFFRQKPSLWFHGDMDSVRLVFSVKGAAGFRPCILCKNILKNNSGIPERDASFVELGASSSFTANKDSDIFFDCDRLTQQTTRSMREHFEKCSGITYDPDSLMFSAVRHCMPPSKIIYDVMHLYFANGVASWEISLFIWTLQQFSDFKLYQLQALIATSGWKSFRSSHKTTTYLKGLFADKMFSDDWTNYKGQAHQTSAALSLLMFFFEVEFRQRDLIPDAAVSSFRALYKCASYIRELQYKLGPVDVQEMQLLDNLQRSHQDCFQKAYDMMHRPKHHYRLHLPKMWTQAGTIVTCDPLESKHRVFKSGVGDRQKSSVKSWSTFSAAILGRLMRFNVDILLKHGLPFWQLLPPIKPADLDDKIFFSTLELQCSDSA